MRLPNRRRPASLAPVFALAAACVTSSTSWSADNAGVAATPGRGAGASSAPVAAANAAVTDRATFFANAQFQAIWQDLEKRQVINQRVVEGGQYSINVRIVKPTDAPLVHGSSADVWVVTAGSATAVTGGKLLNQKQRPNGDDIEGTAIEGGSEHALAAGDIEFVPPGVPHGFKDVKGFRAFLIRFETK